MDKRGRHENHKRGPRVERVAVTCEVCGKVREYRASEIRVRGKIRFCSIKCMGLGARVAERFITLKCDQCGIEFEKRRDHLKPNNYCSPACASAARRTPDAKWRSPSAIKAYMRQYVAKNRAAHNSRAREWWQKHRPQKTAQNRARRAAARVGEFTDQDWQDLKAVYGHRCLCCGKCEPDVKLEVDHILALAKGGKHCKENIQPLCRSCNASKGTRKIDYR